MLKLRGIVTGASRGIGAAIAIELDRRGYEVYGLSRSGRSSAGTGIVCDMTDEGVVRDTFGRITDDGPVTVLVNNAGFHVSARSSSLSVADYTAVMALNATAVMVACREIYPSMKDGGGGMIVNIGSFFDKLGVPGNLAYCSSKAAVGAMTRCLAVEWASVGIRLVNIAPGYIETDLSTAFLADPQARDWLAGRIPLGRPGTSKEVATAVGMVIETGGALMTGETVYLDGGQAINQ